MFEVQITSLFVLNPSTQFYDYNLCSSLLKQIEEEKSYKQKYVYAVFHSTHIVTLLVLF